MLLSLTNDAAHGFTDNVFIVTATGSDTLTIGGFRHDIGFFGLDDISVVPVPEPGSLGLLGISLAGLGIRLGRRSEPPRGARLGCRSPVGA
jgi:PEP-CTERM motif